MRRLWLPSISSALLLGIPCVAHAEEAPVTTDGTDEALPVASDPTPPQAESASPAPSNSQTSRPDAAFWFMPGFLLSGTAGVVPALGLGAEASVVRVTDSPLSTFGIFGQAQSYNSEYGRYAGGVEMGWGFGAELGYDFREAHNEFAGTHGVHVAAFASLGLASLAWRTTVPVATASNVGRNQGFETGLAITVKIPVGSYERLPFSVGHGRPPRRGHSGFRGRSGDLAAQLWQERATQELASVATFIALAQDLAVHGAPAPLVRRAVAAARDEWSHAKSAAQVAAAMGGQDFFFGSSTARTGASLQVLVHEAVCDGMVGEGAAAGALRGAAEHVGAGQLRDALMRTAAEEQAHAALAEDVVAWALGAHPSLGLEALARQALAQAPRELPVSCTERALRGRRTAARHAGLPPSRVNAYAALRAHAKAEQALRRMGQVA